MSRARAPNEWVRRLRVQRSAPGYYLEVMALDLGISRQAVAKLLAGVMGPSAETMARAERAYGVRASAWLDEARDDDAQPAVARDSLPPFGAPARVETTR